MVPSAFFITLSTLRIMDYSHTLNNFDKYDEPRLHIERLLKVHLLEFGLSLRILCPLEDAGIITLGDLVNKSAKDLLKIKTGLSYK